MSFVTHEELRASHQTEIMSAHQRAILGRALKRIATVFVGFAVMAAIVTAMAGFKTFIFLSRTPLLP